MEEQKSDGGSIDSEEYQEDEDGFKKLTPPKILYNQKCPTHNLVIHSFVKATRELLCTKCIYEKNLSTA